MKRLHLLFLIMSALLFTSCDWFWGLFGDDDPEYEHFEYNAYLGFKDTQGKDLVKHFYEENLSSSGTSADNTFSTSISEEYYRLDVAVYEPLRNWSETTFPADDSNPCKLVASKNQLYLSLGRENGTYFLVPLLSVTEGDSDKDKKIVYKLKFPKLFGNEKVYEIVTYWRVKEKKDNSIYYDCIRVECDESVIETDIKDGNRVVVHIGN